MKISYKGMKQELVSQDPKKDGREVREILEVAGEEG